MIRRELADAIEQPDCLPSLDDGEKARLTSVLVDSRNQQGERWGPLVTPELIERARRARSLAVHERAERILRFLGTQSQAIGDQVDLSLASPDESDVDRQAMAWSESTTLEEIQYLADYLADQSWLQRPIHGRYTVTVDGHRRISDVKTNPDSGQGFVAMWFDEEMEDAYSHGIAPAIESAGYKPMRIDQKADVVKIDDEIVAEIRRSRFLVADFTQGDDGARGGVYFEAGFALGLGIPVIYTCREGSISKIHFDTRQYHHTAWNDPADLRDKLEKRILALIGEGPGIS